MRTTSPSIVGLSGFDSSQVDGSSEVTARPMRRARPVRSRQPRGLDMAKMKETRWSSESSQEHTAPKTKHGTSKPCVCKVRGHIYQGDIVRVYVYIHCMFVSLRNTYIDSRKPHHFVGRMLCLNQHSTLGCLPAEYGGRVVNHATESVDRVVAEEANRALKERKWNAHECTIFAEKTC